jgi:hypothetical protein
MGYDGWSKGGGHGANAKWKMEGCKKLLTQAGEDAIVKFL